MEEGLQGHCDVLDEVGYELYVAAVRHECYFLKEYETYQVGP